MTHSNITTSNHSSDQQQSNIAQNSNSAIQLFQQELIFNGDGVYLAVKNKIKIIHLKKIIMIMLMRLV